jgi:CheY-like chemotaxis protein
MLEGFGYRVTAVSRPEEAISLFRAEPHTFDLVIADVMMPVLSGTDLAREMLRIRPEIPVLLSTGYDAPATVEAAHVLGVRALVRKPMDAAQLARAVSGALGPA